MPKIPYYIVDKITFKVVEGPYGKKKCIRILEKTGSQNDFLVVRSDEITDYSLLRAVYGNHPVAPERKPRKKKVMEDKPKVKESDFSYRTGFFDNKTDLKELMERLGVDVYHIQHDKKGYFALYNDTEDEP